jgi:cytochrome c-type biogenesis protein CcmH/NrfG
MRKVMGGRKKKDREDIEGSRKGTVTSRSVKIETAVVLVIAAFFVGLLVGAVVAVLKTSPTKQARQVPAPSLEEIPSSGPVKFSEEIQALEELVRKDAENPEPWVRLGDVAYRSQQYEKAIDAYRKASDLRPPRADILIKLGNAQFDRGAYQEAIEAYSEALTLDPRNADVLTDLGIAYRRTKRPEKAVESFRKAAEIDARHLNSRYNLGVVLFHDVDDREGAIRAWEAFLQIEPSGERAEQVNRMVEALKTMPSDQ